MAGTFITVVQTVSPTIAHLIKCDAALPVSTPKGVLPTPTLVSQAGGEPVALPTGRNDTRFTWENTVVPQAKAVSRFRIRVVDQKYLVRI